MLVVGRRLQPKEVAGDFENFVDLTSEFREPAALRRLVAYRSFPILDASAPSPEALREVLESLRPGRTFVHCAQGHGRTGLFAAALLIHSHRAKSPEEAVQMLQRVRPGIMLNAAQRACLERFAEMLGVGWKTKTR
jgi:protein-tyrosine phosphatase